MEQGLESTDAVGHSSDGGCEGVFDHFLGDEVGLVQVVGGDESRWDTDPQGLYQGVEAEVLSVDGYEASGLQVDDHLAGPITLGNPQGQVNLADQDQPVVAQFGPDTALSHRSPCRFEIGPAFDELAHRVDRLGPQLGSVSLATAAQPVAEVARVSFEAGQGLVDQDRRFLLAPPID